MSGCSISALRKCCKLIPVASFRWQGIISHSLILSAFLSVSLLFPSCTKLGSWDLIASARQELIDAGSKLSKKRISISLAALAQNSSLSNFPVLVRLQPNVFLYADCRADGLDIRFRTSDGTELAFERDSWNKGGTSDFWVKIPTLAVFPQDTRIWLYFGDETATDGSDAAGVWTNGFVAVLHGSYEEIAGVRYYRNSLGTDNPETTGGLQSPADLAGSSLFGGSGFSWVTDVSKRNGFKFRTTSSFYNLGPLSFEVWLRDKGTPTGHNLFFKGKNSTASLYASIVDTAAMQFVVKYTGTDLKFKSNDNIFTKDSWIHFALVWDGALSASMYSNGVDWGATPTVPSGVPDLVASDSFVLGNDDKPNSTDEELIADLDEIRISNVQRSADWIKAQYLSQLGDKLRFGAVEDVADGQ